MSKTKVIASADVRILAQNQVMSKKRIIVSADVQISAQHLVMSKIRSRRPQMFEFLPEIEKNIIASAGRGLS